MDVGYMGTSVLLSLLQFCKLKKNYSKIKSLIKKRNPTLRKRRTKSHVFTWESKLELWGRFRGMEGLSKRNRKTVCLRSAGESQDHPADWFPGAAGLPKGGHMVLRRLSLDVCVKSLSQFPLWDPMDCNLPGSSVHGIFQARILEWVAIPFSRGTSQPRDQTRVSRVSCIGRRILVPRSHLGSPDTMNELRHVQRNKTKWVR